VDGISEHNKRTVRLFVEAVWNEGRLEVIDELVAEDYVGRIACVGSSVFGPRGVRRLVSSRRRTHPDLHVKIEDQIAEEDRVVTRWRATSAAPAARAGSTGRTPCYAGISVVRLLAGKLVDSHTEYTNLAPDAPWTHAATAPSGPA
jgi:limonene-1,2-epoxide hydrolase